MKQFFEWLVYVPILWLTVFFGVIGYVTIRLGHIPQYGADLDPSALGLMKFTTSTGYILLPGVLVWVLWPFIGFAYLIAKRPLSSKHLYIYLMTLVIFLTTYCTGLFEWFLD
ncbi:MAG: hypothetical protein EOP51_08400 [Sphingobacteriales bacterium]|nr:MAG: hypothetical protein EOP51_08400 [Sphingobacteriales bacterium]